MFARLLSYWCKGWGWAQGPAGRVGWLAAPGYWRDAGLQVAPRPQPDLSNVVVPIYRHEVVVRVVPSETEPLTPHLPPAVEFFTLVREYLLWGGLLVVVLGLIVLLGRWVVERLTRPPLFYLLLLVTVIWPLVLVRSLSQAGVSVEWLTPLPVAILSQGFLRALLPWLGYYLGQTGVWSPRSPWAFYGGWLGLVLPLAWYSQPLLGAGWGWLTQLGYTGGHFQAVLYQTAAYAVKQEFTLGQATVLVAQFFADPRQGWAALRMAYAPVLQPGTATALACQAYCQAAYPQLVAALVVGDITAANQLTAQLLQQRRVVLELATAPLLTQWLAASQAGGVRVLVGVATDPTWGLGFLSTLLGELWLDELLTEPSVWLLSFRLPSNGEFYNGLTLGVFCLLMTFAARQLEHYNLNHFVVVEPAATVLAALDPTVLEWSGLTLTLYLG